jgi:hypothetical protein
VALRSRPVVLPIARVRPLPAGWYVYGQDRRMLAIHKGGSLPISASPTGDARLWLRGRTTRDDRVAGRELPRSLQRVSEWIEVGRAEGPLTLERPKRSLRPGDAQPDIVGPLIVVGDAPPQIVTGAELREACGLPADWIDNP